MVEKRKEKFNPGDLVKLDPKYFQDWEIKQWGIGLFINGRRHSGDRNAFRINTVYWFGKYSGIHGVNQYIVKVS